MGQDEVCRDAERIPPRGAGYHRAHRCAAARHRLQPGLSVEACAVEMGFTAATIYRLERDASIPLQRIRLAELIARPAHEEGRR
jgi:hypothetical protein